MSIRDEIYTIASAAEYLGISEGAIKQKGILLGVKLTPKLKLFSRAELEHYKKRRRGDAPFDDGGDFERRLRAEVMTTGDVAKLLDISPQAVQINPAIQALNISPARRAALFLRSDIEAYRKNPTPVGRPRNTEM